MVGSAVNKDAWLNFTDNPIDFFFFRNLMSNFLQDILAIYKKRSASIPLKCRYREAITSDDCRQQKNMTTWLKKLKR